MLRARSGLVAIFAVLVATAWIPTPMSDGGCIHCFGTVLGCEPGQHVAIDDDDPLHERGAGSHELCFSGTCAVKHPNCGAFSNELELLKGAIQAASSENIATAVRAMNGKARLNVDRKAIQVYGCNGALFAHFPVQRFADVQMLLTDPPADR